MAALSSGHLATDLAQGSLPALLPFFVVKFDLSYTMAAALVLGATISSSLIQPAFGAWSDVRGALWLLPSGVALAGVGMALAAVAPTYPLVMLAVLAAGVGVAAYHPEGSKFASYVSGEQRASGMAFFSVGGNLGFALGPVLASGVVIALGLTGGLLIALPGLVVAAGLLAVRPYLEEFAPSAAAAAQASSACGASRTWASSRSCRSTKSHAAAARRTERCCSRSSCSWARSGRFSAASWPIASAGAPFCSAASSFRRR
jgi:FSR family fosmidomycin resistance protein-like MFS transporter